MTCEAGRVVEAKVGYLSVSEVPTVVDLTEVAEQDPDLIADRALVALEPVGDVHATADYRAHLVRVLTRRVLAEATEEARQR